jgi:hypothetical protein
MLLLNIEESDHDDLDYVSLNMLRTSDQDWSPEQILWLAVVAQALLDATKEPRDTDSEAIIEHRRAATRWLTVVSACVTAEDMEEVCELAGISSERIRKLATNILIDGLPFERFRINALLDSTTKEK